ncbi:hypothetical protein [Rhodococcus aetherivorans]|uniref:hypothetical protein n=1 Tax=Rhodococcus aetherivorans TaxID=191292 RepID=UPI00368CCF5D
MQGKAVGDEDALVLRPLSIAVLDGLWVGSGITVGIWVFGSLLWAVVVVLVCAGTHAVGCRIRGGGDADRVEATGP